MMVTTDVACMMTQTACIMGVKISSIFGAKVLFGNCMLGDNAIMNGYDVMITSRTRPVRYDR